MSSISITETKPKSRRQKSREKKNPSPPVMNENKENNNNERVERAPKVYKYPIIRNHKHPEFPKLTYNLPHSFSYTQPVIDELSRYHPCTLEKLKVSFRDNEHPFCAAMRAMVEAWTLNELIHELEGVEAKGMILDVGGSAKRHASQGRDFVWSCNPKFDARDFIRQFKLPGNNHCEHLWSQCDCQNFLASISVHSLYYIEPADMLVSLLKQQYPVHYAVVHLYDGDKGTLMMGESWYEKEDGRLWVYAKGNLTPYSHKVTDWMRGGHYADANGTLEWDQTRRFGDTYVLRFVASPNQYPAPPRRGVEIVEEVEQTEPETCTDAEEEELFEEIVRTSICYGAEIHPRTFSTFMHKVNRKGNEKGLDTEKLAIYAGERYKNQPNVIPDFDTDFIRKAREKSFRLKFGHFKTNWKLLASSFAVIITLVLVEAYFRRYGFSETLLKTFAVGVFFVIASVLIVPKIKLCQTKSTFLPTNFLGIFRERYLVYDYCCSLPHKKIDKTKCRVIKKPSNYGEECEPKPAARPMIFLEDTIPYFPRKCVHNAYSSIRNKLLHDIGPVGEYSFPLHPVLIETAAKIKASLEPLTWEEWVGRFPNAKKTRLENEYNHRIIDKIETWNDSGMFVKFEAMATPKYPRPVISSEVEFNFQIGRWLVPLAELMAVLLPSNILFPIHGDACEIGDFYDTYSHFKKGSGDFTSFDSSQREAVLRMFADYLRLCGVPEDVVKRELQDCEVIVVKTKDGMKVIMVNIRCSGRSATLIGNTTITINTYLHVFGAMLAALMAKGDDAVPFVKNEPVVAYVERSMMENGFLVKYSNTDDLETEFCSSIFVPYVEGSVLTPKPGKLLAKTFWSKQLHYSDEEIQDQFVGIAKGLEKSLSQVPGIRGIYRHPLYLARSSKVEAYMDEYNEYASQQRTMCDETINFVCDRYGLTEDSLLELEEELSSGFPIKLSCYAARVMIEKDWAAPSDNEGFEISTGLQLEIHDFLSPVCEELIKFFLPLWFSLIFGLIEGIVLRNGFAMITHPILHFIFACVGRYSLVLALILHLFYNLICCRRQLNFAKTLRVNKLSKMPKRSNKNKSSKTVTRVVVRKTTRRRRRPRKNRLARGRPFGHFALSRVNPFLASSVGVKCPDSFGYPSATAVLRAAQSFSADANGHLAIGFMPLLNEWTFGSLSITAPGVVTWAGGTATSMPQVATMINVAAAYRVVSWGIRITGDTSLNSSAGHFWIAHVPLLFDQTFPYFEWPTTEAMFVSAPLSEKFSATELTEVPVIASGRALDASSNRFRTTNGDEKSPTGVGVESMDGWDAIVLYGAGLATGVTNINVEFVMHVEYIQSAATLYGFIDCVPSPVDLASEAQGQTVTAAMPVATVEGNIDSPQKAIQFGHEMIRNVSNALGQFAEIVQDVAELNQQMNGMGKGNSQMAFKTANSVG